jgi:hypothetical protein
VVLTGDPSGHIPLAKADDERRQCTRVAIGSAAASMSTFNRPAAPMAAQVAPPSASISPRKETRTNRGLNSGVGLGYADLSHGR